MSPAAKPKRRFTPRSYLFFGVIAVILAGFLWDGSPLAGLLLRQAVSLKFSGTRHVTPAELEQWLRDPNRPPPLLIDVRVDEQYAMSHIDGAVQLDPADPDITQFRVVSRETPIVAYDGPGVVSAGIAPALMAEGFTRVSSLEGGLFRWVNEGHPVVDASGPVTVVHPINWKWGRLLKGRYRP